MFSGKIVLVTGGTGTFGKAFVKRILSENVKKVIVFSRDEFKQSEMAQHPDYQDDRLRFFLGDVRDLPRLERAFSGVDIVVHAAALKQVPAIEYNPFEAIKTNILGSQNVVDAALDSNVSKVILISSDKAVQPINLYGATKLCAEKLFVAANSYRDSDNDTRFSVVRYGNVIGSRGSLGELIHRQRETGTITLTDDRMTRFWVRIDDVMEVVLKAISSMHGGEIFVPKMKNMPVKDVIAAIAPECEIKLIGIRPGEKLHELLITEHEAPRTRDVDDVYVIAPEFDRTGIKWLEDKPIMSSDFVFTSDHDDFLLTEEEAKKLFR